MTSLQTCLASFAVASWANNDTGRAMADTAIKQYLSTFPRADHSSALSALKVAYLELQLDSHVATEIIERIERRFANSRRRIGKEQPSTGQSSLA
jgi:hypothetical protein